MYKNMFTTAAADALCESQNAKAFELNMSN